jgi:hypothetical protein
MPPSSSLPRKAPGKNGIDAGFKVALLAMVEDYGDSNKENSFESFPDSCKYTRLIPYRQ